jgi:hypothetical protein
MALTLLEKMDVSGMGNKRMVIYLVTGDGASRTIQAFKIKMQRIEFAFMVNVDNPNFTPLDDYSSTAPTDTVRTAHEINDGATQLLIAYGH